MINIEKKDRTGEVLVNNDGELLKIISYKNNKNMSVQFQDEHGAIINNVCYGNLKKGKIKNPYHKNIYGGYLGEKYKNINIKSYKTWLYVLLRCTDRRYTTYKDCKICEDWFNYSIFDDWFINNYYDVPNEKMQIDKDLLFKDNGLYSPKTCCFLPCYLNHLIVYKTMDNGLPPGVSFDKRKNRFASYTTYKGKHILCGYYDNQEDAFFAYKSTKENLVKQETIKLQNYLPKYIYNALMNWEININDKKWNYKITSEKIL